LLILASVIAAVAIGFFAWRMQDYVFWFGIPTLAAAFSLLAGRWLKDLMVPSLVIAIALAPAVTGLAANAAIGALTARSAARSSGKAGMSAPNSPCFARKNYADLAALPAGNVLSPQDLGPFILAFTRHSAFVAPYHRMSAQILEVHRFLGAAPDAARSFLPVPRPDYLVDCPGYPIGVGPRSLGARLRSPSPPPTWLQKLSRPGDVLTIYKIRPASG
jgi:hypothetical protein